MIRGTKPTLQRSFRLCDSNPAYIMIKSILSELNELDFSKKALQKFGWMVGGVFGLIGLLIAYKHHWQIHTAVVIIGGISCFLLLMGSLFPMRLNLIYRFWMGIALVLGFFMSKVILSVLYILFITPVGWIRRTFGNSPIRTQPDDSSSYWHLKAPTEDPKEALERSF